MSLLFLPVEAQELTWTYWVPDSATVSQIESRIRFADAKDKLDDFDRYYTGETSTRKIVDVLLVRAAPGTKPGIHLVDHDAMPPLDAKDGCGFPENRIDFDRPQDDHAFKTCGRISIRVFLSMQPYWLPDQAAIRVMERALTLPSQMSFRPDAMENYARFYSGYTLDGHRLIQGKLFLPAYMQAKPGIHIVDNETLFRLVMTGGGCGFIMTLYDLDEHRFLRRQCYGLG